MVRPGDRAPCSRSPRSTLTAASPSRPDGKWIAHTTPPGPARRAVRQRRLPHRRVEDAGRRQGKAEKVCRFPARVHDLCWADGGRSLVVAAELGQAHDDLWKLPLDDPLRGMAKLTAGQADEDRPSASRDGQVARLHRQPRRPDRDRRPRHGDRRGGRRPVRRDGLPPADRHAAAPGRGRGDEEPRRRAGLAQGRPGPVPRPARQPAPLAARPRALLLRPGRRADRPGRHLPAHGLPRAGVQGRVAGDHGRGRPDPRGDGRTRALGPHGEGRLVLGRAAHPRELRLRGLVQHARDDAAAVRRRGPERLQLHGRQLRRRRRLRPAVLPRRPRPALHAREHPVLEPGVPQHASGAT